MNREIEARLKISAIDKTGRVLKGVADKMGVINQRASEFNRRQGMMASTSRMAFAAVTRFAAPAAIAYGAKVALTDFAALERQMTRIGITAGASAEETKNAFLTAQQVAKDLRYDSVQPAIEALDTLTASGKTLQEAMDFLPSVLATAQASGAATEDIANTGLKAASALKIETAQLQRAFDIMVTGGKAGQFELKDMAQYIPSLANSFATLGYEGEDGLKRLIAMLQTLREDTGDASSAATQAGEIFGKIYAADTATKFKKFGIDLRKELASAKKAGEDTLTAFIRLSKEAVNGDMSKLPLLFTDKEFRLGMQSLLTSEESFRNFMEAVNSAEVNGAVWRDVNRVFQDTQSKIDGLSNSWERMKTSLGSAVAEPAGAVMDAVSNDLDRGDAVRNALKKQGMGYWDRESWMLKNMPLGSWSQSPEIDKLALQGGYRDPEFLKRLRQGPNLPAKSDPWWQTRNPANSEPEFPGGGTGKTPVPGHRPLIADLPAIHRELGTVPPMLRPVSDQALAGAGMYGSKDFFRVPSADEFRDALKIDTKGLADSGEEAGNKVAEGGREAGEKIGESAALIRIAGYDVSTAIADAAQKLAASAAAFNQVPTEYNVYSRRVKVNADTGRSMPPSVYGPSKPGGGGW